MSQSGCGSSRRRCAHGVERFGPTGSREANIPLVSMIAEEQEGGDVAQKAIGGGSSAVAASTHAACQRFRRTDPLITGSTRRGLAKQLGFADQFGGIPESRWMRAMTFERLVRDAQFASRVATTAVGRLGLSRPTEVVTVNAHVSVDRTADLLSSAHSRAVHEGAATMLHGLAVPFVGFEDSRATDVKPDFAVVAPKAGAQGAQAGGSWLVMGDAKDYERVRSRIDDARLLKGFLQVALGAESAAHWSQLPEGMEVHHFGALAVPRNAFLQPEALVEDLADHRGEVRMRVAERRREAAGAVIDPSGDLTSFVAHLEATFDPETCTTCTLFSYCRDELRRSERPEDLLVELGVSRSERPQVVGLVDGTGTVGTASESTVAMVTASLEGKAQPTNQRRLDQAGQPGTVNVVLAKSDSAALGVYGMAVQRILSDGARDWVAHVFDDPQGEGTRRKLMSILGRELTAVMKDRRVADAAAPSPVHLVVPDRQTADVLASIADNLAGIELSRLRWQQDLRMGRTPLTFDGEPASIPPTLPESDRTAVSFLLEEDRARALTLRSPIVDVRRTLASHLVAGGPAVSSGRLDYLVAWAQSTRTRPLQHRAVGDLIEESEHTPGARLTNKRSDDIHRAYTGRRRGEPRPADAATYEALIREELAYKCRVMNDAVDALAAFPESNLREAFRAIEGDAQAVWRRRLALHASDLVRFGRTYRHWRNSLVPAIESDDTCAQQLLALTNPVTALDAARDAGTRHVATARVVSIHPLVIQVDSRRVADESRVALLHVNGEACVEGPDIVVKHQVGSFKISGLSIGRLAALDSRTRQFSWYPDKDPVLAVDDELVIADFSWFGHLKGNKFLPIARPDQDEQSAPKRDCAPTDYADDPVSHQYCCRPHEAAEADWSDELAARRARGELNPQVWPPVVDGDAFEVTAADAVKGDATDRPAEPAPENMTMDDID